MQTETSRFLKGVTRAFAGAAILGVPLLLTMEMWWLGFQMERWKLALLFVSAIPVVMFLSHFSGYEKQEHWKETIMNGLVMVLVGLVLSPVLLLLFGQLTLEMPFREWLGKIAIQAVPTSIGAAIARSLLEATGEEEDEKKHRVSKARELFLRVVGALVIGFDEAPTEEMVKIAAETRPAHIIGMILLCIAMTHAFAFALEQKAHRSIPAQTSFARLFFTTTLPGYATALVVCAYLLWLFGRFEGMGVGQIIGETIVLGVPASLGAAAVRVVL